MRLQSVFLGSLLASVIALHSCKTTDRSKDNASDSPRVGGAFDANGEVRVSVPVDINGFTPRSNMQTSATVKPTISGLNLAESGAPTTTEGVEELSIKCFTQDSLFIAKGWYFYAELATNGKVIKTYNSRKVDQCNEIQLSLKTLAKDTNYVVKAAFFWQSDDGQQTIVWYEGETEPFKPSDRNQQLILEKLRVDQAIEVEVAKSEKDQCLYRKYLWNGSRCLDGFNSLAFVASDVSDYATSSAVASSRSRKCLQMGADQKAIQYECANSAKQRLRTILHGTQELDKDQLPSEYGWFVIQFDSGKLCLTAKKDPAGGDAFLAQEACATGVPGGEQLFTLVAAQEGDKGGRDSFRIMNQFNKEALCISVPPEAGDITGVTPVRNGAPIKLTPCSTTSETTRVSQFVRFVESTD